MILSQELTSIERRPYFPPKTINYEKQALRLKVLKVVIESLGLVFPSGGSYRRADAQRAINNLKDAGLGLGEFNSCGLRAAAALLSVDPMKFVNQILKSLLGVKIFGRMSKKDGVHFREYQVDNCSWPLLASQYPDLFGQVSVDKISSLA